MYLNAVVTYAMRVFHTKLSFSSSCTFSDNEFPRPPTSGHYLQSSQGVPRVPTCLKLHTYLSPVLSGDFISSVAQGCQTHAGLVYLHDISVNYCFNDKSGSFANVFKIVTAGKTTLFC